MTKTVETNFEGYLLCRRDDVWQIRKQAPFRPGRPRYWYTVHEGPEENIMKIWRNKFRAE